MLKADILFRVCILFIGQESGEIILKKLGGFRKTDAPELLPKISNHISSDNSCGLEVRHRLLSLALGAIEDIFFSSIKLCNILAEKTLGTTISSVFLTKSSI